MVVDCSVVYKISSWMKFFLKNIWQKGVRASRDVTFPTIVFWEPIVICQHSKYNKHKNVKNQDSKW
jgi:hypothetical protein